MISLTTAINRYFGRKEGQTLPQFAQELKVLTEKDRMELAEMLTPVMGETVSAD